METYRLPAVTALEPQDAVSKHDISVPSVLASTLVNKPTTMVSSEKVDASLAVRDWDSVLTI